MNRKEFDETFSGRDLTIQVRAALDFAQQNGLALGRSMGDQYFIFSRLPADSGGTPSQRRSPQNQNQRQNQNQNHSRRRQQKRRR